jgi:secreted Zn-dependent insulinase-like peptidase
MWHKMDRTFRVPKTSVRLQLTSPNIYRSPRAITLNRLFQKVLTDDLNSYVYDASVAGCSYSVDCTPSAYRLSVGGYSEKIPHLLDVVTSRIASLIGEMKDGDEAHPALAALFHKAKENLLRQTKKWVSFAFSVEQLLSPPRPLAHSPLPFGANIIIPHIHSSQLYIRQSVRDRELQFTGGEKSLVPF